MDGEGALRRLAAARGVLPFYVDNTGRKRRPGVDSLVAAVRAMGEPVGRVGDAPGAWRAFLRRPRPLIEPVHVAWDGRSGPIPIYRAGGPVRCMLVLEDGGGSTWDVPARAAGSIRLPGRLPIGRHTLTVSTRIRVAKCTVLSAPSRVGPAINDRTLALFAPLYALRSPRNWGIGDLTDLARLAVWAGKSGCRHIGVLPLLASFLEKRYEPSPYAPVSRLFWNEVFLDPAQCPEFRMAPRARRAVLAAQAGPALDRLRKRDRVDYRAVMRAKRPALEHLAKAAFDRLPRRRESIERWMGQEPEAAAYAAVRAAVDGPVGIPRSGYENSGRARAAEARRRYHLYVQFAMREQLGAVRRAAAAAGCGLYLDLPIGVHPEGFDTWRFPACFAHGVSVGAPPDPLAAEGQNWGFPPLDPEGSRRDGHAYFAATLRNHLRFSDLLRIDHVMALHRLFWIPAGATGRDGVYVRYPAEELYAAMSIEAARAGARIVGENLGTVPPEVNETLERRGVLGMYVAQFTLRADSRAPLPRPPRQTLACVNTHDTPMWAGYFRGDDLRARVQREARAVQPDAQALQERAAIAEALARAARRAGIHEADDAEAALRFILDRLASSDAAVLLATLEDFWLELQPQNTPGTAGEHNWTRKVSRDLHAITSDRRLAGLLKDLARRRGRMTSGSGTRRRTRPRAKGAS